MKRKKETPEQVAERMAKLRAKRKPAQYKNIHPTVLATANKTVNIEVGNPIAFSIIPE